MDLSNKIIKKTPLEELWTDEKVLNANREEYLLLPQIRELLQNGPVQFVIAELGSKLQWLPLENCYDFFKSELKDHLVTDYNRYYLEDCKDGYAYLASRWASEDGQSIVLLETYH
jgi:hypothetical protein